MVERTELATERTTSVVAIHPTVAEVPRNLLRLYVWFSAPMSEGESWERLWLADDEGVPMADALLAMQEELWDASRQRLTVLLDPARIKRGLVANRELGYPLQQGVPFHIVVDEGFRDARGVPLKAGAKRRYLVGGDERRRVDPTAWRIVSPAGATTEPLRVEFDRALDHGLVIRCLRVIDPDGGHVGGRVSLSDDARSWKLEPAQAWRNRRYTLDVDPMLEDLAGNSVRRVFDRAVDDRDGEQIRDVGTLTLPFTPS